LADPFTGGEVILKINGSQYVQVTGGTSLAAPIFSAEWAIANQYDGRPLGQAAQVISRLPSSALLDVKPVTSVTNPAGTIFDKSGVTFYSPSALVEPLQNTTTFFSAFYNEPSSGFWYALSFGTDSSLTVAPGWDNVTGWGTPNGLKFIQAAATH
jgi:subtilase family serine protease